MEVIEKIVNFYNRRIDVNKDNLINAVSLILGENLRNITTEKVETLMPIYVITREGIDRTLETSQMHSLDRKLIDYLESYVQEQDKYYLGYYGYLQNSTLDLINRNNRNYVLSYYEASNKIAFHYEQDIFGDFISKDLYYINHLLIYMGIIKEGRLFRLCTSGIVNDELTTAYSTIINELSLLIIIGLHSKDIFVLDNKSLVPDIETLKNYVSLSVMSFYKRFSDIIYLFITDFKGFMDLVGKEEFLDFFYLLNDNDMDSINIVLDRMEANKNNYMSFKPSYVFDSTLIETSVNKYRRKFDK